MPLKSKTRRRVYKSANMLSTSYVFHNLKRIDFCQALQINAIINECFLMRNVMRDNRWMAKYEH